MTKQIPLKNTFLILQLLTISKHF